jgi:thioredoxin-dependent peroxiredoxin
MKKFAAPTDMGAFRSGCQSTFSFKPYIATLCALLFSFSLFAETPKVGTKGPDFTLSTPTGTPVKLSEQEHRAKVVLILLRGYPGYQCPYCQRQAHDFIEHAPAFATKKAIVLLVYPGPAADLDQRAKEFLAKQANLPANVILVTDPDYKMTNLYDLRWDAPHETAYPSTFILDRRGTVLFEKISHGHGDRTTAQDMLDQLPGNTAHGF